ncbi:hypothetical protein DBR32_15535 [Taibaiella sp. KBW10]|uniref:TOMM precursor leader peptide-binding protein n=1 Tax=Taibaiella sp. KBW10 TaxID=2153357 RepID=UPI000F5AD937|nr:TOMM precursor leader peptide-binding protein [Taibaiella sp. KBW10]RQO29669.1 hypothetical protein DBR32_15535 [Taibaiella sp. KBW10]
MIAATDRVNLGKLSIDPSFHPFPVTDSEIWLFKTGNKGYLLKDFGTLLLPAVRYLTKGTSVHALMAVPEAQHPNWKEIVLKLINTLEELGLLKVEEDNRADMSDWMYSRFEKQLAYFDKHAPAERSKYQLLQDIRQAHVLMLGLGSLGTSVIPHLTAAGIGKITGVDMDVVETHNLARATMFTTSDIGKTKTEVAAAFISKHKEVTQFDGIPLLIDNEDTLRTLFTSIAAVDLVILTADTPTWQISVWVSQVCNELQIPMIRGNRRGIGPLTIPNETACPACDWPRVLDQFPNAAQMIALKEKMGRPYSGSLSPILQVSGALLAQESIHFLAGMESNVQNAVLTIDFSSVPSIVKKPFLRDTRCRVCGTKAAQHD